MSSYQILITYPFFKNELIHKVTSKKHYVHGRDCYIVKELLSLDGQLHNELAIKGNQTYRFN